MNCSSLDNCDHPQRRGRRNVPSLEPRPDRQPDRHGAPGTRAAGQGVRKQSRRAGNQGRGGCHRQSREMPARVVAYPRNRHPYRHAQQPRCAPPGRISLSQALRRHAAMMRRIAAVHRDARARLDTLDNDRVPDILQYREMRRARIAQAELEYYATRRNASTLIAARRSIDAHGSATRAVELLHRHRIARWSRTAQRH